jgi:lysophospholipase L1-like esterase
MTQSPRTPRFDRYVAIGDSTTEGLDDPDGRGHYRGWADRLAARLHAHQGELHYANLAIRGRHTRQIRDEQLAPALAMRPDLVTLVTATNDILQPRFDLEAVIGDMAHMQRAFRGIGATVITFTLPDLTPVMPVARLVRGRVFAWNDALRRVSTSTGTLVADLAAHAVTSDPRLWSEDRLHANSQGHARIAEALVDTLGLPTGGVDWARPLPEPRDAGLLGAVRREASWARVYLLPWVMRHARGRSSGDGRGPKRPALAPFQPEG